MGKKNLLLISVIVIIAVIVIVPIYYTYQIVTFNQKIEMLRGYPYLFGNMSWIGLKTTLTKGYYYRVDPYQIKRWGDINNVTNYTIMDVNWDYIKLNMKGGCRVYYDADKHRIWMFWSTQEKGGLLITVYSPTKLIKLAGGPVPI